ncbi:MAG: dehydrogenase [Legionellaceae bacterium]|nr:dehydrogenase [Legionellaceae bacterium]
MRLDSHLGSLANPSLHNDPLNLSDSGKQDLLANLRMMLLIRRTEELIADMVEAGEVKCPCHLGIGQEAIAVGVLHAFRHTDRVFGTHRAHAHYLAMGGGVYELFAEVLGKVTGCSKGLGGSMHLLAQNKGFYGSLPIVGGTVPIAVGAALAAKMDGKGDVACCFFGDGTVEEGVVHESLNLAAIQQVPVLFVCENNFYSSHLDIRLRQPSDREARFAEAHHIDVRVVDGNDLFAVQKAADELIAQMRKTNKPAFIEAVTYRWRGHVGPKEDIDVGVRRRQEDLLAWKMRDPIRRLADGLIAADYMNDTAYQQMQDDVESELQSAIAQARQDDYPAPETLYNNVYA